MVHELQKSRTPQLSITPLFFSLTSNDSSSCAKYSQATVLLSGDVVLTQRCLTNEHQGLLYILYVHRALVAFGQFCFCLCAPVCDLHCCAFDFALLYKSVWVFAVALHILFIFLSKVN